MTMVKDRQKERKVNPKTANFPRLETHANDGNNEERKMNIATRQVNLSGVLGSGQWEEKDWPKECSAIADTGFNGGGLCSHAWMQRYVMHLEVSIPKPILRNTKGTC